MSFATDTAAQRSVNALRGLAIDAVEAAGSGHPGLPLGAAPMAYVLWRHHLRHAPTDPRWPNRDRFVLSAGHGSALLYALLHLSGYDLSKEDLAAFRRLGSRTPGHPEPGCTPGVEVVTGPLGQGAANSVGLALAERLAGDRFNRPGFALVDHHTWALLSDGDMMEGVCFEAAALAGHWRLGKLIWLYDSNGVTLDGPLAAASSEDIRARFASLGWQVLEVADGDHDLTAIDQAMAEAKKCLAKPSLLIVHTTIGYGAPHKAGSNKAHGSPLGAAEASATKRALGLPAEPFAVDEAAWAHMQALRTIGLGRLSDWAACRADHQATHPSLAAAASALWRDGPAVPTLPLEEPFSEAFTAPMSTRQASRDAIAKLAPLLPYLLGGDGDVGSSTLSQVPGTAWLTPTGTPREGGGPAVPPVGNVHYGVREHAMGAIANGLAAHGSVLPFAATFFAFSDYQRPAVRLSALAKLGVIWLWTHDSVGLGEDGPTHQPIEQLASLRAMPQLTLFRPADAHETMAAWQLACTRIREGLGPQALVLSRQTLPLLPAAAAYRGAQRGGYVVTGASEPGGAPDVVLLATGSEVHTVRQAQQILADRQVAARVVSLPSWELFAEQPLAYRTSVLGEDHVPRVSLEAGSTLGWHRWLGHSGIAIGIDAFGQSGPGAAVLAACGITAEAVVAAALRLLEDRRLRL